MKKKKRSIERPVCVDLVEIFSSLSRESQVDFSKLGMYLY